MYELETKSFIKAPKEKALKREVLRYNEYYRIQSTFDNLYKQSKGGQKFNHLYDIITSRDNILLAYRKVKRNKGSKTAGTNKHNIKFWEERNIEEYVTYIQKRLENYVPQTVRRKEIPKEIAKPNGKKRPLGIPCIEDRLIQQCIKQVLEPICEAKFFEHSYGFRPNRSTEDAVAYAMRKVNQDKCYYVVDVDIKGFFDNVNHGKLLKQLWAIGIQDKKVLSIISKMLKAEIKGIGIPEEGTPQGGILSPLLANVVLNELDWWIASQWQYFKTKFNYSKKENQYTAMKKSRLKEIFIVRYADDFKIFCRKKDDANKIFEAVKQWLKERLSLEISEEKSQVIDIRKTHSDFLGIKLKAFKKKKKWIIQSHMTDKAMKQAEDKIRKQLNYIKKNQKPYAVQNLNRIIAGLHNEYKMATQISKDFNKIKDKLLKYTTNLKKKCGTKTGYKTKEYFDKYKKYDGKEVNLLKVTMYPIEHIKTKPPMLFNQKINNYSKEGRKFIHTDLQNINKELLNYLLDNPLNESVELNDNRISLYTAQKGRCAITNRPLQEDLELHHITPRSQGGKDTYKNLMLLSSDVHKLLHATREETIKKYKDLLHLSKKALKKLNRYRTYMGNEMIMSE